MLAPLLLLIAAAAAVLVLMLAQAAGRHAARHQADHVWISLDIHHQKTTGNTACRPNIRHTAVTLTHASICRLNV